MSNFNSQFQGAGAGAPNGGRINQRQSGDFRSGMPGGNGNAPMPVPTGNQRGANGHGSRGGGNQEGARSPPNNKSTAHVPRKFFRQGTCQAGKACPFMHTNEPTTDSVCKYFQKGNCKFGAKCALAHVLPDGRRVNKPTHMGGGGFNRMNVLPNNPHPGDSLLSMQMPGPQPHLGYGFSEDPYQHARGTQFDTIPTIDTTFSSRPVSNYGSPPAENRLGVSPMQRGLGVMDTTLPASSDSNGISHIARYGPIAKSVPGRFDIDSPSSSLPQGAVDSATLRNLHNSAFGEAGAGAKNALGSSPPQHEAYEEKVMQSQRAMRSGFMAASLDTRKRGLADWELSDDNFPSEDESELVPGSLNELLTDQERMRRFSRTNEEHPFRQSFGTPHDSAQKVGSPKVGSPSRFSALFARQQKNEGADATSPSPSAFGHVGSPLRNSSLHPGASPSLRAVRQPTSSGAGPFVSSPPRQASMSMISQQLQRTRLNSRATSNPNINDADLSSPSGSTLHPGMTRATSGSSVGSGAGRGPLDRAFSSGSIGRADRIDEEQGLFSMEDEEEAEKKQLQQDAGGLNANAAIPTGSSSNKRFSGGWGAFAGLGATKKDTGSFGTSPSSQGSGPGTIGGHRSTPSKDNINPWGNGS